MIGQVLNLEWKPPGPVSAAFMRATKSVQILNGPIGSGKTTSCLMKAIRIASRQAPSSRDGVRKFKLCVVRDTYRQLWKTTLPSWWKRIPRDVGVFTGAENGPASHHVTFELGDKTTVDFHVDFIAIGENAVEDVLRGYEPTAFYLNECDLLAHEVYTYARGRAGRYPDMSEGGPSWYGVLADANAPELHSWLYQQIFKTTPDDVTLLRQPGAFEPGAENIENLPPGYYENQRSGQPDWYVKRMLENQPGYSRAGKPIYPEFNDLLHVAPTMIEAIPGIPLQLGIDAGGTPAAAFAQRMPNGQWRILREVVTDQKTVTGALRMGDMIAKCLHDHFQVIRDLHAWADPSAAYGADKQAGEASWIEMVAARAQIRVDPAPTNRVLPRWEAVRKPLSTLIDGKPAFLLSPACVTLREGFNSGYRFRKLPGTESERFSEEAEKNEYSHPHDALQYLLSGGGEDMEIRGRSMRAEQDFATRSREAQSEWNPLG